MTVADVREHGATGDGTTDDHAAIAGAIAAVDAAGGGTVFLPAGVYAVSAPLGNDDPGYSRVCLLGDGERASTILATGNFATVTGAWTQCRIENLMIDAGGHGGPGMVVDLDKSYVRHCWVRNWSGHGISLNPTRVGLLNWIDDTFVEQCVGTGVHTTYRFYDSWIVNNNIGSSGPNLSVESGPVRILANHLNGSPRYNIELRGNKSLTVIGNICEGSRREAIIYTMPAAGHRCAAGADRRQQHHQRRQGICGSVARDRDLLARRRTPHKRFQHHRQLLRVYRRRRRMVVRRRRRSRRHPGDHRKPLGQTRFHGGTRQSGRYERRGGRQHVR